MVNWYFGWSSILAGFVTGAGIGLYFYDENFLGGYQAFRRRILRLGHIAQIALGLINVLVGFVQISAGRDYGPTTVWSWMLGGLAMPAVCFLSAWRPGFRRWFFVPVGLLITAVLGTLLTGLP